MFHIALSKAKAAIDFNTHGEMTRFFHPLTSYICSNLTEKSYRVVVSAKGLNRYSALSLRSIWKHYGLWPHTETKAVWLSDF